MRQLVDEREQLLDSRTGRQRTGDRPHQLGQRERRLFRSEPLAAEQAGGELLDLNPTGGPPFKVLRDLGQPQLEPQTEAADALKKAGATSWTGPRTSLSSSCFSIQRTASRTGQEFEGRWARRPPHVCRRGNQRLVPRVPTWARTHPPPGRSTRGRQVLPSSDVR